MAIAFVQSAQNTASASTTNVQAYTSNVTAGSLLIVVTDNDGGGSVVSSVVDSLSQTWVQAATRPFNFSTKDLEIWYFANSAAGANTVTVTYGGSVGSWIGIGEYSGVATTSPLDKTASDFTDATGSALDSTVTATTALANELLIGAGGQVSASATWTVGTNFTLRESKNGAVDSLAAIYEDRIVSATGAYKMTATSSDANGWGAIIVTFKSAPGPATFPRWNPLRPRIFAPGNAR